MGDIPPKEEKGNPGIEASGEEKRLKRTDKEPIKEPVQMKLEIGNTELVKIKLLESQQITLEKIAILQNNILNQLKEMNYYLSYLDTGKKEEVKEDG